MRFFVVYLTAFLFLSFVTPNAAYAEGYALYEYSARGVALGNTTLARKPDASYLATNPAAIVRLEGSHIMLGSSFLRPVGKVFGTDRAGRSFSNNVKDKIWPVPHFYFTTKITDKLAVGIGEFTRFGLGFEYPSNWPGRFNIYDVDLQSYSFNPNVALAVTDKLSVAVGLEIIRSSLNLKRRSNVQLGAMQLEVDSNIEDASNTAYGYNLAAHYQFNDKWAAGLSYRSHVTTKNTGEMKYKLVRNNAGATGDNVYNRVFKDGDAWGRVRFPESVSGAVSYSPTSDLSIELGATWTRWSRFDALDIHLPDMPNPSQRLAQGPKAWKNTVRVGVGVEYDALDWLVLRAGYVYDPSPMPEKYEDYLVPTDGRNIYSVGFGLHNESWSFDFAYAYVQAKGRVYSDKNYARTGVLRSKSKGHTDVMSFTLGYHF